MRHNIYLAGPMEGKPERNTPAFNIAADAFRRQGHEVFNPAEIQDGRTVREYLKEELSWICEHATAIALLPGWENSKGANAEFMLARALGLQFIYL